MKRGRLAGAAAVAVLAVAALVAAQVATARTDAKPTSTTSTCQLANGIKHVIYLQFDNVHLTRDNPNVASDLEQMPHLLSFLESNGTMLEKSYTILISHTAGGILSSLTGLYPDRMGTTVSNSYDYYPSGSSTPTFTSAFKYWTAPVSPTDSHFNMITSGGKNTPAPWVSYTRAGCDVGNASVANTVLENGNAQTFQGNSDLFAATKVGDTAIDLFSNTGFKVGEQITIDHGANQETATIAGFSGFFINLTAPLTKAHARGTEVWGPGTTDPSGDLTTTFGEGSPEWQEGVASQTADFGSAAAAKATTDFVGIAVHCAATSTSICSGNANARPDVLPDEPGGYDSTRYRALFGAKYVDPAIAHGAAAVPDINGSPITDSFGQAGFPGFDGMSAANSLGYVAAMQEAGIPVTYAYISDVHDNHAGGGAYGPGEAGYVAALKSYDAAFAKFIDRLAGDGINSSNTLFVVTADENDHYAGQQAQNCDGVTTMCTYNQAAGNPQHGIFDVTNNAAASSSPSTWTGPAVWPPAAQNGPLVGEVGYNMKWLFGTTVDNTGYDISFDSAPSWYINGQPQALDASGNVVLDQTVRDFEKKAADLKAFDPYVDATRLTPVARYIVDGPTLRAIHMLNADPQRNMSFTMFSVPDYFFQTSSPCPSGKGQGCVNDGFAWIHGDYSNDIGQTWLGLAGPGVASNGLDRTTWTDHTDIVPTIDALTGLTADYTPDGRAITQVLTPSVAKGANGQSFTDLGDVYKQLDAPYGDFAHSLIVASTKGIKGDDSTYLATERAIQSLASQRDTLVAQMQAVLDGGAVGHREQLIREGRTLLDEAAALAAP
jgi:hypothetical protein